MNITSVFIAVIVAIVIGVLIWLLFGPEIFSKSEFITNHTISGINDTVSGLR